MDQVHADALVQEKLMAVATALDERDAATYWHCNRVAGLSLELGRALALSASDLTLLLLTSALHDIGKIGIPDSVLKKPGAFNDAEWAVMKTHSVKGQRIVRASSLEHAEAIGLAVRHHHERYDGRGYPDGLGGSDIPILARIVAVTDTYDAMAIRSEYGPARAHVEIMDELRREQGRQHDPVIVQAFADVIESSQYRTT